MSVIAPAGSYDFYPVEDASIIEQQISTFDLGQKILFDCVTLHSLRPTLETEAQLKLASLQNCAVFGHVLENLCGLPKTDSEALTEATEVVNFSVLAGQTQAENFYDISPPANRGFCEPDIEDAEKQALKLAFRLQHGRSPVPTVRELGNAYTDAVNANLCTFLGYEEGANYITRDQVAQMRADLYPEAMADQNTHFGMAHNLLKVGLTTAAVVWSGQQLLRKII